MSPKKVAVKKRVPVRRGVKTAVKEIQMPQVKDVSLALYRRIALVFVILVATMLAIVLYLSTVRATILVTPIKKPFTSDLIIRTTPTPIDANEIKGTVVVGTVNKTKTFSAKGAMPAGRQGSASGGEPSVSGSKTVDGFAKGSVTITNKGNIAQTLVATTRFLSPQNVLFRLDKTVTVPAQGTIVAMVHADQKGSAGDLAPTHFTIPGLSEAKQALVYADNESAFSGGLQTVAIVTKEELEKSFETTKTELLNDAKEMLRSQSSESFEGEVFDVEIKEQTSTVKPDAESKSYDVTMTITVTGVFFDGAALKKMMMSHVYDGVGQGQALSEADFSLMKVTVEQVNTKQKTASVHARVDGFLTLTRSHKSLEVSRFLGMSIPNIRELLLKEGIASDVSVRFFPFWMKNIPRLKDQIEVKLK